MDWGAEWDAGWRGDSSWQEDAGWRGDSSWQEWRGGWWCRDASGDWETQNHGHGIKEAAIDQGGQG